MSVLKSLPLAALLTVSAGTAGAPAISDATPPAVTPPVATPTVVTPPVVAPAPVPALPPAAVTLSPVAAEWLRAAGIPCSVVTESNLPTALEAAVLAVVPAQEVRQTATVSALKAHIARGGRAIVTYWGPVGARNSVLDGLAELLSIRVTGWSGKGNTAIVPVTPAPGGRVFFSGVTRLKTGRPYAVVAAPVIPPAPPPPPAPPANAPKPTLPAPRANAPAAKPNANAPKPNAPAPVVTPPPPPPPAVVGRWVGDDGKPLRRADAAVIAAPATLWIGEDVFLTENDSPEMRRWFAAAAVALAPSLRLPAKQAIISSAQVRLDGLRTRASGLEAASTWLNVTEARRGFDAASRALATAAADMDFAVVLTDAAAAATAITEVEAALTPSRPVEIRAALIPVEDIGANIGDVRRLVQRLADAGFNVLMPEVVARGAAAFFSTVYPRDARYPAFDPLRTIVDEAHRRGIEVHPRVWMMEVGENGVQGPILKSHPEWAMRDLAGRVMTDDRMFWISPSDPAAQTAMRNVVREIASRYDVDGIHLDKALYPGTRHDYSDAALSAWRKAETGDPLTMVPPGRDAARWHAWREAQLNALVRSIHKDVEEVKPGLPLSVTVYRSPDEARRVHLQNWGNWAANHWVDWVTPAVSLPASGAPPAWLEVALGAATDRAFLVPEVSFATTDSPGSLNARVAALCSGTVQGVVMVSPTRLTDDHLRALKLGAFRRPALTPWKNPILASRTLAAAAAEALRSTPAPDAPAAVSAREALAALEGWAGGNDLPAFSEAPPPVAALGADFAVVRGLAQQAVQVARVGAVARRAAEPPVPPSDAPVPVVERPLPLPSVRVPVAMRAVTVDGALDEPAWNDAATLELEHTHEGGRAPVGTTVRLLRDVSTLYIGFTCREPNMAALRADQTQREGRPWEDDSVEVFLSPNSTGLPYMHFAVGAGGATLDGLSGDTRWGARWTSAVTRSADAWQVEIAIPFSSLGATPEGAWRANFMRNRMPDVPTYVTWSVPYGNYHTVERFGRLGF